MYTFRFIDSKELKKLICNVTHHYHAYTKNTYIEKYNQLFL